MRAQALSVPAVALLRAELLRVMREWRAFAFMALLVLVGCLVVWVNFPSTRQPLTTLGRSAQEMYLAFSTIVLVSSALFLPALAATAIVREREQETFDQLAMTLIPPKGMVAAKFINALGIFLLIVAGSLPVLGSAFFLVGLDPELIVLSLAVLILASMSTTAIGIAASAFARRSLTALILAYLGAAFFLGGHCLFALLINAYFGSRSGTGVIIDFGRIAVPIVTLLDTYRSATSYWERIYWAGVYHISIVFVCAVATIVMVRRGPKRLADAPATYPWRPGRGRAQPIGDRANPMALRESQWGLLGRLGRRLLLLGSLGLYLAIDMVIADLYQLYNFDPWRYATDRTREAYEFSFLFFMGITLMAAPLFVVNLFTRERETNSLDMLRVTLLTPWDVYLGKVRAGVSAMRPLFYGFFAASALIFSIPVVIHGQVAFIAAGILTSAVALFFVATLSAYVGIVARRTATAVVVTYAVGAFMLCAFPALVTMAMRGARAPHVIVNTMTGLSSPISGWDKFFTHGDARWDLWIIGLAIYTIVSAGLAVFGVRRLARADDG